MSWIDLQDIKDEILQSDTKWSVRSENENTIHFLYTVKDKNADCCSTCCLTCIFFPLAIIYALLGGKRGYERQIRVSQKEGMIDITGHPYYILKVFKRLSKKGYKEVLNENEEILRARKWGILLRK